MAKFQEGERVRIKVRPVTEEDRKVHMFFEHMQGLEGTVSNHYNKDEVAVEIDLDSLVDIPKDVHRIATERIREKFNENTNEEIKKLLTKDEQKFTPHYVLLVREADLEKA
ncbi:MAG: hypothetical protein JNM28_09085 [Armatimonadetes bacterium]|nr:hypothetical protein [Armatimonadota bacterium]MBS1710784.1 hypothetical protein [Armatimonadota bacterium]MBX3108456.1 hypothetical protein [Fimbriimonadaceae bacterium]